MENKRKSLSFKFSEQKKTTPKRVIILGTSGIISSNLQRAFDEKSINYLPIGRSKLNLKKEKTCKVLAKKIRNGDSIVFIAAEAPVKNSEMLINNLKICATVCEGLEKKKISHLIYISSDAVYADNREKISETSVTSPSSLHGLMHITREKMLKIKFDKILCILRPTLIYGMGDKHNGYGPNRFLNLALKHKPLKIFGNGEEKRDHIFIDDIIKIIVICLERKGLGTLNLVTGKVYSFKYLAELISNISKSRSKLVKIKRIGPMPHNGYRPFSINLLKKYFGNMKMTSIEIGITKYLKSFYKS